MNAERLNAGLGNEHYIITIDSDGIIDLYIYRNSQG